MNRKYVLLPILVVSSLFSSLSFAEVEPPDTIVYEGDTYVYAGWNDGYKKDDHSLYDKFRIEKDVNKDGKDESFFLIGMNQDSVYGQPRAFLFIYKNGEILKLIGCYDYFPEGGDPIEFADVNKDGIQEIVVHTLIGNAGNYLQIFMFKGSEIIEVFDNSSTSFGCIMDKQASPFRITVYGEQLEGTKMPDVQYYTEEEHGHLYDKKIYEWKNDRFVKI